MATGEPNQELLKSAELEKFKSSETSNDLPGKSLKINIWTYFTHNWYKYSKEM